MNGAGGGGWGVRKFRFTAKGADNFFSPGHPTNQTWRSQAKNEQVYNKTKIQGKN